MTHIHLVLDVNFDKKSLVGAAILSIEKVDASATQVILDSRELLLESIVDDSNGAKLDFTVHPEDYVGSKLEIALPKSNDKM